MAMATTPRSSLHGSKLLCLLLMLVPLAAATQFKVGGVNGWSVPTDPNSYNQWAQRNRFQIGDSLLFVYPAHQNSVLRVTKEDYVSCNTANPLARSDDGNTIFTFNQSGPYYFISGVKENCIKNESLVVVVMVDRSNRTQPSPAAAPPTPAPSSSSPPPQPSAEMTPPSPSPPGGEFTSAAPEATSPPPPSKNAASLKVVGVMGSIGAFIGSLALFIM